MVSKHFYIACFLLIALAAYVGLSFTDPSKDVFLDEFNEKQKGAHVFGVIDSSHTIPLQRNNFNWITLVPYGDQERHDSPVLRTYFEDSLRNIKRNKYWIQQMENAHKAGFKVFFKPHVWLYSSDDDRWRTDIYPENEANWFTWKESYREFVFRYAQLAEEGKADMFCVGTELTKLALKKPEFWRELIADVKEIYSGPISYAANWYEEYEEVEFWDELDYIGVQAYFPLVKNENPSIEQIAKGWNKHLPALESLSKKYQKKILFTELGYKSTTDAAIRPWEWIEYSEDSKQRLSDETQANCYEAFFNSVWEKEWFAGMHLWQWTINRSKENGRQNLDFTPQGKLAEKVLARGFK